MLPKITRTGFCSLFWNTSKKPHYIQILDWWQILFLNKILWFIVKHILAQFQSFYAIYYTSFSTVWILIFCYFMHGRQVGTAPGTEISFFKRWLVGRSLNLLIFVHFFYNGMWQKTSSIPSCSREVCPKPYFGYFTNWKPHFHNLKYLLFWCWTNLSSAITHDRCLQATDLNGKNRLVKWVVHWP